MLFEEFSIKEILDFILGGDVFWIGDEEDVFFYAEEISSIFELMGEFVDSSFTKLFVK
jgi:hypothetical protein